MESLATFEKRLRDLIIDHDLACVEIRVTDRRVTFKARPNAFHPAVEQRQRAAVEKQLPITTLQVKRVMRESFAPVCEEMGSRLSDTFLELERKIQEDQG